MGYHRLGTGFAFLLVASVCLLHLDGSVAQDPSLSQPPQTEKKFENFVEGGADQRMTAYLEWLLQNNALITDALRVRKLEQIHASALEYKRNASENTFLFSIPLACSIYSTNPHLSPATKAIIEAFRNEFRLPGAIPTNYYQTEMALAIMVEAKSPGSFFRPFLDMFRDLPNIPLFYSEEAFSKFEYDSMADFRTTLFSPSISVFLKMKELESTKPFVDDYSVDDFALALARALGAFRWGDGDLIWIPLTHLQPPAPFQGRKSSFSSALQTRSENGSLQTTNIPYSVVMLSEKDHAAGDVAFNNVGPLETPRLALQHGIIFFDNPNDFIVLNLANHPDPVVQSQLKATPRTDFVGTDGKISTAFVKAVNLFFYGSLQETAQAYRAIFKTLQQEYSKFSTTVELDVQKVQEGQLGAVEYLTTSFRVVMKRHMISVAGFINTRTEALEKGFGVEEIPLQPSRGGFPLRVINMVYSETALANGAP